jgi:hypothetical protein
MYMVRLAMWPYTKEGMMLMQYQDKEAQSKTMHRSVGNSKQAM